MSLSDSQPCFRHSVNLLLQLAPYYSEIDRGEVEQAFIDELTGFHTYSKAAKYDINKVMVYEAKAAKIYWDTPVEVFNAHYPSINFNGRRNKSNSWNSNASDEINALFNYGYAILESQVRRTISSIGLDHSVGYLHELKVSNTPLVYDLQELYRWLVDLSVIQVL